MKTSWIASLALLGALAVPSHAIFGIGGQWAPAPSFQVKGNTDTIAKGSTRSILLQEQGTTGLQGFGVKVWLDALPLVDLELAGNMQFGYYNENLILPGDTTAVNFKLGAPFSPFLQGKPFFARAYGDASVLYPFLKFPPLISLLKVYAGGGVTYGVATQILDASFAKQALLNSPGYNPDNTSNAATSLILANAIKNAGFENGFGWFLQLGAHVKPPVIPIAVFLDFKYHFMGFNPALIGGSDLTMELGGALAF